MIIKDAGEVGYSHILPLGGIKDCSFESRIRKGNHSIVNILRIEKKVSASTLINGDASDVEWGIWFYTN